MHGCVLSEPQQAHAPPLSKGDPEPPVVDETKEEAKERQIRDNSMGMDSTEPH